MNKILIALLGGVTLGILFAPNKGAVTRKQLKGSIGDWKKTFFTDTDGVGTEFKNLVNVVRTEIPDTPQQQEVAERW